MKKNDIQSLGMDVKPRSRYRILYLLVFLVGIICVGWYFLPLIKTQINTFFYSGEKETIYVDMVVSDGIGCIRPKKTIGNDIVFIFDIDDTLLHTGHGLSKAEFIYLKDIYHKEIEKQKFDNVVSFLDSIKETCLYTKTFLNNKFTSEQFWGWSDSFAFTDYVKRDEKTIKLLTWLGKHVRICGFTNAEILRTKIVFASLGINGLIETVITTTRRDKVIINKPMPEAYKFVDEALKILDKKKVYFFDDSEKNVAVAKAHGWNAYYTPKHSDLKDYINQALADAGITKKRYSDFGSFYNEQASKAKENLVN